MRIIAIIKYLLACAKAITEGLEVVSDNWPTDSPFGANKTLQSTKSQGREGKQASNKEQQIQGSGALHNSPVKA